MQQTQQAQIRLRTASAALCALVVFAAANVALGYTHPQIGNKFEFPYHGWSYWSLNAIRHTDPDRINLALLGSSLVVSAIAECDATFKDEKLDLCYYRGAEYFDGQLRKQYGRTFHTMDLSTPGQIPSDAFLTMKAAIANGIAPGAVIYGIAPRDFIDQTLKDPCETEPFHYLSHQVDLRDSARLLFEQNPFSLLDWLLQRKVWLYGTACDLSLGLKDASMNLAQKAIVPLQASAPGAALLRLSLHSILADYQPFDIQPGTTWALPSHTAGPFMDNSDDYRNRYKHPNPEKYRTQMQFLQKLIALCQYNDIDVILVNMPISKRNLDLLDPQWKARYDRDVRHMAAIHEVAFLDLCDTQKYSLSDFRDTVHLNSLGARKFINELVDRTHGDTHASQFILSAGTPVDRPLANSRQIAAPPGIQ